MRKPCNLRCLTACPPFRRKLVAEYCLRLLAAAVVVVAAASVVVAGLL